MFVGFEGALTAIATPVVICSACYFKRKKFRAYNIDPQGKQGAFEPLLQKYLRLAEFTIGLATGSIVLLIGSSVLHGKDGHLPAFYASPLLLLAASVAFGVGFMAWLILSYEHVQHGNVYSPLLYSLTEAFGFSSLSLFLIGYFWLIVSVTR